MQKLQLYTTQLENEGNYSMDIEKTDPKQKERHYKHSTGEQPLIEHYQTLIYYIHGT